MSMRTLDISLGGLKLESNFDLRVGEPITFAILTDNARIHCKGRVLATEESQSKVRARLCFAPPSDWEYGKLSDYLKGHSRRPFRGTSGGPPPLPWKTMKYAMTSGAKWVRSMVNERQEDKNLRMVHSWLALLTDIERRVITLRFGFEGGDPLPLESTGERLGLPSETVRQIERGAIEKLRRMSRKKELDLDDVI